MDIKEFIIQTITAIVESSNDLQGQLEAQGVILNPPVSTTHPNLYEHGNRSHTSRRVELVEFDIAVTATSEAKGGGKVGLKVLIFEAGGESGQTQADERVSRVKFSLPLVLSATTVEGENKQARERFWEDQNNRTGTAPRTSRRFERP